jgi:hypothetical protein
MNVWMCAVVCNETYAILFSLTHTYTHTLALTLSHTQILVPDLVRLHAKYKELVSVCFQNNSHFQRALTEAFEWVLNSKVLSVSVCVCVCVCVFLFLSIVLYIHTHIHTHTYSHAHSLAGAFRRAPLRPCRRAAQEKHPKNHRRGKKTPIGRRAQAVLVLREQRHVCW